MKSLSRLDVVFQLTPSRRATWIYRTIGEFFSFQLTPSRRATHRISMILSRQDISTHALTEGDPGALQRLRGEGISTHALTEGDALTRINIYEDKFQLTPSRRATSLYFWIASSSGLFQLTPSRRATENFRIFLIWSIFQLTPSRRATSD